MSFTILDLRSRRAAYIGWALALAALVGLALAPPVIAPAAAPLRPVRRYATDERVVALTFNVSWGLEMPRRVLAALAEANATATFFVSGLWAVRYPELVREMLAGGHQVASLGYRHVDLTTLSAADLEADLFDAGRSLAAVTGREPVFLRPPDGRYSPLVLETALRLGYTVVTWHVDSRDWKEGEPERIARHVLARVVPGAIIVFQASNSALPTDRALPAIAEGLRQRGYRTLTLSELLAETD
ncbi:MAG TPA: polysaccharide deacetylase family protein [Bacillota bacterium]|nr:polysaccharide deacetylase family protein [Bacillota bacterium]